MRSSIEVNEETANRDKYVVISWNEEKHPSGRDVVRMLTLEASDDMEPEYLVKVLVRVADSVLADDLVEIVREVNNK